MREGPRTRQQRIDQIMNFGTRHRRGGLIAAGAGLGVAGLNSLIGGERDKREEEEMYR